MAQNTIIEPKDYAPAWNPQNYVIDSTNSAETGFRYIFDVYPAGSGTKLAEYRVAPRIDDSYGEIDISRLLASQCSPTKDFSTTSFYSDSGYYEYDIKVGEEYNVEYAYTGFTDSGGFVQLTGATGHPFTTGDQVNVTETVSTNPLLDGLHTVTATGATTITLDIVYADLQSPSSTAGIVIYADNRKSITRDITTFSGKVVFNAAVPWADYNSFDYAKYQLTSSSRLFVTNQPNPFNATPDQDIDFLIFNNKQASTRYMYYENSDGDILRKDVTNASEEFTFVPSGPNNSGTLTVVSGTLPLVKSTTEWYDVYYHDGVSQLSDKYRITIDNRCKIEDFEIKFMDRLNSWSSFSFSLKALEKGTITRESYNQNIQGSASGGFWTYNSYDKGQTHLSVEVDKEYTLNSNWMTQEENEYFEELLTSPETYIKIDSTYYACMVNDTSFETVRQRGRTLIRKTINVTLANKDSING